MLLYLSEIHSSEHHQPFNSYEELTLPEDVGVYYSSITENVLSLANQETPTKLSKAQDFQGMPTAEERPKCKSELSCYVTLNCLSYCNAVNNLCGWLDIWVGYIFFKF